MTEQLAPNEYMAEDTVRIVPIEDIVLAKKNRRIDNGSLKDLTESIKAQGVLSPVLLRPVNGHHELVYGERRVRAAKAAGLEEVPALVRELGDVEAMEIRIIENLQRQDVHPLEEADAYRALHEAHGLAVDELAAKVGKSKSYVYGRMKLCALVKPARKAFLEGELTAAVAQLLARIPDEGLQAQAANELIDNTWPVTLQDAREHIEEGYMLRLDQAGFSKTDAELLPEAGPCSKCPKRTGNQPELFADVESKDTCTDPPCFQKKRDAHWEAIKASAPEKGVRVLSDAQSKKAFSGSYLVDSSGLVDLDKPITYSSADTYRQVLSKQGADIQPVFARDGSGNIRELADAQAVKRALPKEKRSSVPSTGATRSESERAKERKRKARKSAASSIVEAVGIEAHDEISAGFWRLLALLAFREVGASAEQSVMSRYKIKLPDNTYGDARARAFAKAVSKHRHGALRGIAVELLLSSSLEYFGGDGPMPLALTEAARLYFVDVKAIEREAIAAAQPKKKPARPRVLKKKRTGKK